MITYQTFQEQTVFSSSSYFSTSSKSYSTESTQVVGGTTLGAFTESGTTNYGYTYTADSQTTVSQTSSSSDMYSSTGAHTTTDGLGNTGTSLYESTLSNSTAGTSVYVTGSTTSGYTLEDSAGSATFSTTWNNITGYISTTSASSQEISLITSTTYTIGSTVYSSTTNSTSGTTTDIVGTVLTLTYNLSTWSFSLDSYNYDDESWESYSSSSSDYASTTGSVSYTYTTTSGTTSLTTPFEVGTVVIADAGEWLWSFTNTDYSSMSDSSFLSDVATSFTRATFWPTVSTYAVSFFTYSSTPASSTITGDASTTGFTENVVTNTYAPHTITITTGRNIERDTTTQQINFTTTLSTSSFTDGFNSYSQVIPDFGGGLGYGTYTTSITQAVASTIDSTNLLAVGLNQSTFAATRAISTSTTYSTIGFNPDFGGIVPYYLTGSSGTDVSNGQWSYGISRAVTLTQNIGINYSAYSADNTAYYERLPGVGGMKPPNAMAQTNAIGTNISFTPSIFYPFTSSVVGNVVVPIIYNGSTTHFDTSSSTVSWKYSWSNFSLSWTTATTGTTTNSLSSTVTTTSTGSSSGTMVTMGDDNGEFWHTQNSIYSPVWAYTGNYQTARPAALGGYAPVSSGAGLGVFAPAGYGATSYNTAGSSSTDKGIRTDYTSSTMIETVRVEMPIPIYQTTTTAADGYLPIVGFEAYGTVIA